MAANFIGGLAALADGVPAVADKEPVAVAGEEEQADSSPAPITMVGTTSARRAVAGRPRARALHMVAESGWGQVNGSPARNEPPG